jgi:hypothetical protein
LVPRWRRLPDQPARGSEKRTEHGGAQIGVVVLAKTRWLVKQIRHIMAATIETKPRQWARSLRDFGRIIKRKLKILLDDLPLLVSVIIAKLIVKRELKRREAQKREVGNELRKSKLLMALRKKTPK